MSVAELTMPSLGADMDAGTIVEWRVAPGDTVHRGDIAVVISTEKADMDVEVFVDGTVEELLVREGETVAVGTPLARIGTSAPAASGASEPAAASAVSAEAGDGNHDHARVNSPLVRRLAEERNVDLGSIVGTGPGGLVTRSDVEEAGPVSPPPPVGAPPVGAPPAAAVHSAADVTIAAGEQGHVRASPLARARARRQGIDLAAVAGSGPGGAVVAADLDAASTPGATAGRAGAAQPTDVERRAALRRAVGDLMVRSKRDIPHYYLESTIDLGPATAWIAEANADRPPADRLVPAALFLRSVVVACASNRAMNGHWVDGAFQPADDVDLGVAISLRGGGLVAPAIAGAHALGVDDLMVRLRGMVERARSGRLRSSELIDPTITVTNLGDQGSDAVYGVIYPPQVALVGFGRVVERPWIVDGDVRVRPVVTVTLAADHRVSDGHDGAVFLSKIDRLLQRPEKL